MRTHARDVSIAAIALLVAAGWGCAPVGGRWRGPTLEADLSRLGRDLDGLPPVAERAPSSGSIWTDAGPGAALVRDTRAFRVNDLLTIRVAEAALGTHEASTDLDRTSEADFGAPVVFGVEKPGRGPGQFNLAQLLSTSSDSKFKGDGKTTRSSRLEGFITVRVLRVLPNGDLVVGGQKTVMVNRERQVLTLVGSVRPVDVNPANEVSSEKVGDLTVRLWGRGELDDTVREGWFLRLMHKLWPF
jgi:flagellar L-ring protein precursor FlgH